MDKYEEVKQTEETCKTKIVKDEDNNIMKEEKGVFLSNQEVKEWFLVIRCLIISFNIFDFCSCKDSYTYQLCCHCSSRVES